MSKNNPSYDQAIAELQGILNQLNGENVSIDQMMVLVKRAKELIATSKEKLQNVETDLNSLFEL